MMRALSRSLVVAAGLLAQGPAIDSTVVNPVCPDEDPRLDQLRRFFLKYGSPVHYLADEFLEAADEHRIDWRLLPSIAIVESGGGRDYKRNNIFGWGSGRSGFASVEEGIHTVASRLANSKLYRGKDLGEILATYNASSAYAPKVLALMETVGPAEIPPAGR